MRVLVAMSGGVDSSVAAAMVLEQGHEVIGVTLKQWTGPDGRLPTAGCCTVVDAEDARSVAAAAGDSGALDVVAHRSTWPSTSAPIMPGPRQFWSGSRAPGSRPSRRSSPHPTIS